MKKILIIFYLLLTIYIFSFKVIKVLYTLNNDLTVEIIEEGGKKGFLIRNKVTQIFLITDKKNYNRTIINKNYNWDILVDCWEGEILGVHIYNRLTIIDNDKVGVKSRKIGISVKTVYDSEINTIDFIFSLPVGKLKYLQLSFFKEDLF